ncbi:hypothetical protein ACFXTH_015428 [Malus domestica]
MHVAAPSFVPSAPPQQIWLTDFEATSHMTANLNQLPLASPFPSNETIQNVGGGQSHREDTLQRTLQ